MVTGLRACVPAWGLLTLIISSRAVIIVGIDNLRPARRVSLSADSELIFKGRNPSRNSPSCTAGAPVGRLLSRSVVCSGEGRWPTGLEYAAGRCCLAAAGVLHGVIVAIGRGDAMVLVLIVPRTHRFVEDAASIAVVAARVECWLITESSVVVLAF